MPTPRAPIDAAPLSAEQQQRRRRATRITALVVGAIAVAIYVAFILSGVLRT
jgi:hypothetical protein